MIPDIIGTQTIAFMDSIVAREQQSANESQLGQDYVSVSQKQQSNLSQNDVADRNKSQSSVDPVKLHKATKEILTKIKKLVDSGEVEETKEADKPDEELAALYFLLVNIIETRVDAHVEQATGAIAHIDLSAEDAIETILTQADLLEATKNLLLKIQDLAKQITPIEQTGAEIQIDPGLVEEVHIQIDAFVKDFQKEVKQEIELGSTIDTDIKLSDLKNEELGKLNLLAKDQAVKVIELTEEQVEVFEKRAFNSLELELQVITNDNAANSQTADNLAKFVDTKIVETKVITDAGPELIEIDPELDQVETEEIKVDISTKPEIKASEKDVKIESIDIKIDTTQQKPDIKNFKAEQLEVDAEVVEVDPDNQVEDLLSDSASGDSTGDEAAQLNTTQNNQANNVTKLAPKFDSIKVTDIGNYLQEQIAEVPRNSKQEIRLQLNPENLGKIDLTITKNENNEISIKMMFHDANTLKDIKGDLKESLVEIKEAMKLKNLDLSKFEVGHSKSSSTAHDGQKQFDSFNEARDEQKERLLNTTPEWLGMADSAVRASFAELVEGI
ncbi:MAG: flagellar hook-length control protein FliK [Cyanobacteria bacterium]|nr:flagellar hook-length control protein FliK [Cyanobacteriota bacterium]MDA1020200.1 flagellar hook-length control protein FliK [Cyanobacteriota bacterium]